MGVEYSREYLPFLPGWTLPVMYLAAVVVLALTAWGLYRRLRTYDRDGESLAGRLRQPATLGPWAPRVRAALADVFLQRKVAERRLPATLHLAIFYGTFVLFLGTVLIFIDEDILKHLGAPKLMSGGFYLVWEGLLDLAGLALIAGVGVALYRRLVLRPSFLLLKRETLLILFGLLFMGLSGFLLEGYRLAAHPHDLGRVAFAGYAVSFLWEGVAADEGGAVMVYRLLWWAHLGGALALIGALAYTGFSHLVTVPAGVLAQDPARPRARLTTPFNLIEALEAEEEVELTLGLASTSELAPEGRLAADACMACGRCHAECPAQAAGRPLSPRDLMQTLQEDVRRGGTAHEAAHFEAAVWSCTNCYACEEACPARIRHVDYVLDFRRALVDQNRLDEQKLSVLEALDRNQNPYRLPSHERAGWLLELPYAEEVLVGAGDGAGDEPEWLYWLGCSAGYDSRASQVALATLELLRTAGVSFATLGPAEPCCGEPAKRLGEEGRFQMIAMTNMELLRESGARKIVTHCPHCLNVLLHEYGSLGLQMQVVHHSELLLQLVQEGRLSLTTPAGPSPGGGIVLHEPCNLARGGRPPASLGLLAAAGLQPSLPERSGSRTFCCGGGGANMWYTLEQEEERISALRLEQLAQSGAGTIATACTFCLSMLTDAAGSRGGQRLEVLDVAELLAARNEKRGE